MNLGEGVGRQDHTYKYHVSGMEHTYGVSKLDSAQPRQKVNWLDVTKMPVPLSDATASSVGAASWSRVLGRGCDEAEISEEKRLFTEWGPGIQ